MNIPFSLLISKQDTRTRAGGDRQDVSCGFCRRCGCEIYPGEAHASGLCPACRKKNRLRLFSHTGARCGSRRPCIAQAGLACRCDRGVSDVVCELCRGVAHTGCPYEQVKASLRADWSPSVLPPPPPP